MRRKVLVVEQESSIRNVIYVMLSALKCDGDVASSGKQALAMIKRESFDAVLLDLRSSDIPPEAVLAGIREMRPSLMGRILYITGEVSDRKTLELIERSCAPCIQRGSLVQELSERLRFLFRQTQSASG